jgi:geranylgeranyl pyrophosphate synthase
MCRNQRFTATDRIEGANRMFESFHQYWQNRRPILDDALGERLNVLLGQVPLGERGNLLASVNRGKKLRGVLLGMMTEVLGGEWESALPRGVAVELIQAATLIHDDFIDQDRMRRHMPAVWTVEGARRAVLLGDVIFAAAIHMMSEIGRDDGRVVSRAIAEISKGALMEPCDPARLMEDIASGHLNGNVYEKIIHLKTGVLFEAACELGAISAGADDEVRRRCIRYGARIGEAYQMADDIEEIGKHLMSGSIHSHEMALLAPLILCYAKEARSHMEPLLAGGSFPVPQPLRQWFRLAMDRMKREIRCRLDLAAGEMRQTLQEKRYGVLGLNAPADIIAMFNLA